MSLSLQENSEHTPSPQRRGFAAFKRRMQPLLNIVAFLWRHPTSAFGLVVFALLIILALLGPLVAPL